jgi:outer membrane biosynthesis protein TonB
LAKTDEGEFELVLGNRQLISVFLIMVILLGVFFSMGYIVGRNSAPAPVEARNVPQTASKPIVVEPPPPARAADQTPPQTTPSDQPSQTPVTQSRPSEPVASEPAAAPKPAPMKKDAANTPARVEKKTEAPSARASAEVVEQPPPGRYWQIVSTSRPEAEIVAETIGRKGFKSFVTPSTKEGYFRVVVGPMSDTAEISKTRTQLEAAGFKNPILQHY